MNLLVLMVWYGVLISCSIAVPRRRNLKHPVSKFPRSSHKQSPPTALEVLERTLLRPNDKPRLYSKFARENPARVHYPLDYGEVTYPMSNQNNQYLNRFSDKFSGNKRRPNINRCIDSFGENSPVCKSRKRRKKSFMSLPERFRKKFRLGAGLKKTSTPSNNVDDFFGLFKNTSSSYSSSNTITLIRKDKLANHAGNLTTPSPMTSPRGPRQAEAKETVTEMDTKKIDQIKVQSVHPSQSNLTSGDSPYQISSIVSKIVAPGNLQEVGSNLQLMYLDNNDNNKNYLKIRQLEETEHHEAIITESSDGSAETTDTELTHLHTVTPLFTGSEYDKHTCEKEKNTKCICSFASLDKDFSKIFSTAKTEEVILGDISKMNCRQYVPKPSIFDLNTNTKPRVIVGRERPLPVDSDQGPKEVTEDSLDEFIEQAAAADNVTRVFVSSPVKLSCFPILDLYLSASDSDQVKYTWTYENHYKKEGITQGRITDNSDGAGTLAIENVELTDTKNYTCEIDYIHPDTGHRTVERFTHSLLVVTLPIVSVRAIIHYKSTAVCDSSLLEMFELYLPQQIEKSVCDPHTGGPYFCTVQVHSPVCHSNSNNPDKKKRESLPNETPFWYRAKREEPMDMSLNIEVFVHKPAVKELAYTRPTLCDPKCFLLIHVKLLEFFKEIMEDVALTPVQTKVQGGGTFTPIPSSVKLKYIFGCIGGYYLEDGFCLACPKGTYSDDGATECRPCPMHTYSMALGTRKCTPCGSSWLPMCNEYFENINIFIIFFIMFAVFLFLFAFVSWYTFIYKGRAFKEVIHKAPKEKLAKSERISRKAKKKKKVEEQEMKALLCTTSAESESEPPPRKKNKKKAAEETSYAETSETGSLESHTPKKKGKGKNKY